jgi:1-acyl-sn-glycerol-3-phosphate acyltransferase
MFYTIVRFLLLVVLKTLFRIKIHGYENIPSDGALIIAANHRSYLDPPLMAIMVRNRQINSMAKDTLFGYPVFGTILKMLNAFPVKKGTADKAAIVKSLRILENNEVLTIFPEGTRYRDGGMGPAYPGVMTIALKTGATVLPVGISGTEKVMPDGAKMPRFPKIVVKVGKPIPVNKVSGADRKVQEEELTGRMMNEISKLIEGV